MYEMHNYNEENIKKSLEKLNRNSLLNTTQKPTKDSVNIFSWCVIENKWWTLGPEFQCFYKGQQVERRITKEVVNSVNIYGNNNNNVFQKNLRKTCIS